MVNPVGATKNKPAFAVNKGWLYFLQQFTGLKGVKKYRKKIQIHLKFVTFVIPFCYKFDTHGNI
jgi:hypothetical protein